MPITIPIERAFDVRKLRQKPRTYWLRVLAVTLAGMLATAFLAGESWWRELTAAAYGKMQSLQLRQLQTPNETALVVIDDRDYWSGPFKAREPLDRRVLSEIVLAIARHRPRVIALDIDLSRSPADAAYAGETKVLLDTLQRVGADTWIVLAKTVRPDPKSGALSVQPDVFDTLIGKGRIRAGYTRLPRDPRQIPMALSVATPDGPRTLDSFALSIARIRNERRTALQSEHELPFGDFMPETAFAPVRFSAASLGTDGARARAAMEGNVVIVGGDWSLTCAGCGDRRDLHITPQGKMPGALIHANFVEALVGEYTTATSETASKLIELAAAALLAMIFVAGVGNWKYVLLGFCIAAPIPICVTSMQNFGIYLDAAALLVLLGAHAALEQVFEWREESRHHAAPGRLLRRLAWEAFLVIAILGLVGALYVRHHAPLAAALPPPAQANAVTTTQRLPGPAPSPAPAARQEVPRRMTAAMLHALEDKLVDDLAAQYPEDARVRGNCEVPRLEGLAVRTASGSTIVRVPPGIGDAALFDLANALRVATDAGARVKIVSVALEGASDRRVELHADRIAAAFDEQFQGTERVRKTLSKATQSAGVPDAQVVVTCR